MVLGARGGAVNALKRSLLTQFCCMSYLEINGQERKPGDGVNYAALQELVASGHIKRADLDHLEFYRITPSGFALVSQ
jgi:hypothetical protein